MKKIISILSIVVIIAVLPVLSFAEEKDPVIGVWYANLPITEDIPNYSEIKDFSRLLIVVTMHDNGDISYFEFDQHSDGKFDITQPSYIGKWKIEGYSRYTTNYNVKVLGYGESKAYTKEGKLHIKLFSTDTYFVFNKMIDGDWYTDLHG